MARLNARQLLDLVLDQGSWESWDTPPARVGISETYAAELAAAQEKAGTDESVLTGAGSINGHRVAVLISEFGFLAGSIGRDAADRLVSAIQRATHEGLPLIGAPSSGGTRMQEGTPAFVQMVRIGEALLAHKAAGLPYLVYLRHPTTGGVMATWGSLGHITVAEPRALLGFLGPKVVELVTGSPLPPDVQTAENLGTNGIIDGVLLPEELRDVATQVLDLLARRTQRVTVTVGGESDGSEGSPTSQSVTVTVGGRDVDAWTRIERTRRPERPGIRELLGHASTVVPLQGTTRGERDSGILLALAGFGEEACVVVAQDRAAQSKRPFGPAGLRTAQRGIALAESLGLPLLTVIDTPGAELSGAAENGAIAGEIARTLAALVAVRTPTLTLMLGQGNGGGALALFPGDRIIAAENAWLTPLPPEGASVIVHGDTEHAAEIANTQRVLAIDLAELGIVDRVIGEMPDAADEPEAFLTGIAEALGHELTGVRQKGPGSPADRAARYA
ncbi:acetyl-CoA carboxylase carboxyltransferase subunit alpha/beta [Nocardioides sp. Kera G14]|uniref:acetyl-CoA carboxylase carboxyltransferase subunit alpha/beta n=1 Tax=Nocardioides sp. Kera G14 TaxID=2884264 RepID=UPI001D10D507|nr:acetyl-CoA carboxylase carboxyltransferase subunit alpha/beta [Nocardioides sp. Kera G14]UDY23256.1 acetyl-CoA carboxylase carboxyltransferase subunit alpha/beta [Nocardioides sp. Kera G14]